MARQLPPPFTDHRRSPGSQPLLHNPEDLTPIRDKSAKWVSRALREQRHILVEEQANPAPPTEQEIAEVELDAEMVTRQKMTVDRFLPGTHPPAQP